MKLKELLGDNYKDGMTIDDVMAIDIEENSDITALKSELVKAKASVSKANSEAADYKKQLKARLSEEELAKQQRDEEYEDLKSKYEALEKENRLTKYKAEYKALGYDDKMTEESAQAMLNGDFAKLLQLQAKHNEMLEKKIKADVLADSPKPQGGNNNEASITKEQFDKMGVSELIALKNSDPNTYNTLMESD